MWNSSLNHHHFRLVDLHFMYYSCLQWVNWYFWMRISISIFLHFHETFIKDLLDTIKKQINYRNYTGCENQRCLSLELNLLWLSTREDGRSMSVFSLYWQLSLGRMANFPAFIDSKSFDLWNHHIPQIKWLNLRHILMYSEVPNKRVLF